MTDTLNKYIDKLELKVAALEEINLELNYKNKKMQEFMQNVGYDNGYDLNDSIWDIFLDQNPEFKNKK